MATAASPHKVARGVEPLRAAKGHTFLWRRLHALSGVVPIGAFLIEHLISNFEALKGPAAYGAQVRFLNSLPFVRVLEWTLIFIPIAFHALYGVFIWWQGKANVKHYPFAGNWAYITQRVTGLIALVYIIQHVARQRFLGVSLPEHPGAAFHKVQVELSNPWMLGFYTIAIIATCWHFSYGLWLFFAKWGITPGEKGRRRLGYFTTTLGIILVIIGLASLYAFIAPKYQNAPEEVVPATSWYQAVAEPGWKA